ILPAPSKAQTPTTTYSQGQYVVQAPDWSRITWDNLPPVQQPGYLSISQNLVSLFGYDPSRSWSAGEKVDSVGEQCDFVRSGQKQAIAKNYI
ncbi:hypothetical protein GNF09_12165, partial [Nostoc sp. UCD120]|nr:hypothetical protein [Nostoc sp. UCD120]